jgi:hypothetical protein
MPPIKLLDRHSFIKSLCFCSFGSAKRHHLGQRPAHCFSWANSIHNSPGRRLLIQSGLARIINFHSLSG